MIRTQPASVLVVMVVLGTAQPVRADPTLELVARSTIQTPRGVPRLVPLTGGDLLRVHERGDVAMTGPDGANRWVRGSRSFYPPWGVPILEAPRVLMGYAPAQPLAVLGERPFDVGDLTGDGVEDVAVGHFIQTVNPQTGVNRNLSAVTVLDGTDGATVWTRTYPGYVTQVLIAGEVLVVGNETGDVKNIDGLVGEAGSRSTLHVTRFSADEGAPAVEPAWSMSTGVGWARWLDAIKAGPNRLAVSWTSKAVGASGTPGRVLLLHAATGEVAWTRQAGGYPRMLRHDASRDGMVVVEQADPAGGRHGYTVVSLDASDGGVRSTVARTGALLQSLALDDVAGGPAAELVTGGVEQPAVPPTTTFVRARVDAIDPVTGATVWTHTIEAGEENRAGREDGFLGLPDLERIAVVPSVDGPRVVVGLGHQVSQGLLALAGADGTVRWERHGDLAAPSSLVSGTVDGEPAVLGATSSLRIEGYRASDGTTALVLPLLADTYAVRPAEVNGDGVGDLVAGTGTGAVFALDGRDLDDDPGVLWRTGVSGPVRRIELADLDGDGALEIVVAATSSLEVLSLDGTPRYRVDYAADEVVWTFSVADADGDGKPDLVVPTSTILAVRGRDGRPIWEHVPMPQVTARASTAVVTPEGVVVVQLLVDTPELLGTRHHRLLVGLDLPTGRQMWVTPQIKDRSIARLWQSVAAGPPTADGQGTQVALTWDVPGSLDPRADRNPQVDVVHSKTGQVLQSSGPLDDGLVPQGTIYSPAYGFLEFDRVGIARLTPEGPVEVGLGPSSDVALADFGPRGRAFLRAWSGADVYDASAPLTAAGAPAPSPVERWEDLYVGRIHPADLDGDGSDELITTSFDWPGYTLVSAFSDTGVSIQENLFHGIAVLEAA